MTASLGAVDLPELPEAMGMTELGRAFTAAQMREYARAAIAALTPAAGGKVELTQDEQAAVTFYALNPSAAVQDLKRRITTPLATLAAPAPPPADGITAEWVLGYLPSSTGQSDERADAFQLCREEVAHAFAEWAALHPAPPPAGVERLERLLDAMRENLRQNTADFTTTLYNELWAIFSTLSAPSPADAVRALVGERLRYLERFSDDGQHMKIPGPSAGDAWHIAQDLRSAFAALSAAPAGEEVRGIATGDTPTFADVWTKLDVRERAIISAKFAELKAAAAPTPEGCQHKRSHGAPWRCAMCGHRFDTQQEGGR